MKVVSWHFSHQKMTGVKVFTGKKYCLALSHIERMKINKSREQFYYDIFVCFPDYESAANNSLPDCSDSDTCPIVVFGR